MVARSCAGSTGPRFAAPADGATEAGALEAFIVHLERQGLLQSAQPRGAGSARASDNPTHASNPEEIESAVRKLIAVLREPS
jgi:hypothetical protein